jgi:hypothetical protein
MGREDSEGREVIPRYNQDGEEGCAYATTRTHPLPRSSLDCQDVLVSSVWGHVYLTPRWRATDSVYPYTGQPQPASLPTGILAVAGRRGYRTRMNHLCGTAESPNESEGEKQQNLGMNQIEWTAEYLNESRWRNSTLEEWISRGKQQSRGMNQRWGTAAKKNESSGPNSNHIEWIRKIEQQLDGMNQESRRATGGNESTEQKSTKQEWIMIREQYWNWMNHTRETAILWNESEY